MNLKTCLASILALAVLAFALPALAGDNGGASGTVPSLQKLRFKEARVATTATSLASVTNLIQSGSSVVGGVWIVPNGASNLTVEIHDAAAATGATAANEVFIYNPAASVAGVPVEPIILGNGKALSCTIGIVVVTKPADTTTVVRTFLLYDTAR